VASPAQTAAAVGEVLGPYLEQVVRGTAG